MHLPLLPVGDQLVEHQSVDVAAASPQHHQHDDLELVRSHGLARQRHRPFDDELAQQGSENLRAFEKSYEAAAFQRQLGRFVRGVSTERDARVKRFRNPFVGLTREAVQPFQRVVDVVILEPRRVQLALERIVVRIGLRRVIVLEEIDKNVEHDPSTDALVQASREAGYLSIKLQLQQHGGYDVDGQATATDQFV